MSHDTPFLRYSPSKNTVSLKPGLEVYRHTDCVCRKFQAPTRNCTLRGGVLCPSIDNVNCVSTLICLQLLLIVVHFILFYFILFYRILLPYFCPAPLSRSVRGALQMPWIDWLIDWLTEVTEGHWTWYITYDFLLMFHSNYGSMSRLFWCRNKSRPWNPRSRVNQGHW